jgi:hypothetical protein
MNCGLEDHNILKFYFRNFKILKFRKWHAQLSNGKRDQNFSSQQELNNPRKIFQQIIPNAQG